jgi:aspartyl-tRNA(Asn)/glutamyl-tRNA(Gln) amidotransferase subunit C
MKLSREEVLHIALLARVGVTDNDVDKLSEQLSNILEHFETLKQVDTENVPPTAQSIALQNVTSDDVIEPSISTGDVLANAPDQEAEHFKIRAVLEDHSI